VNASDATPDVIFSTAAGRIGIIGELGAASTRILDDLQRNLEQFLKGPGDLDYSGYRRARLELGSKPSVGFVDGDL
jgi:DNA damage-binding protein 1